MKHGHAYPGTELYGKLGSLTNHAAYCYWVTRDKEPDPPPEFGMMCLMETDADSVEAEVYAREVYRFAESVLACNPRWQIVLRMRFQQGLSLEECGARLLVSRDRVRQIEVNMLRLVRRKLFVIRREWCDGN